MNRHVLRVVLAVLATSLVATPAMARHHHRPQPAENPPASSGDQGGVMTFDVQETGQKPAAPTGNEAQPGDAMSAAPRVGHPPTPGTPSRTLEKAIKLYESDDYYSATIELNKVLEANPPIDDEGNRQRAEFYMGKALFQLKYYASALTYFDRIVQKGPDHAYYNKTLQWLASLSQFLPDSAGVLDKIGKYTRQDLEQPALEPVRDQLFYLLGRFHYVKGTQQDLQEALDLFQSVPEKSDQYSKAKFFEGMTYVRQYQAKPAAESFKAILRKAIENPDKNSAEFVELANLQLARTFYSLHQFPLSVKYYDKIDMSSPDWLSSLFEASWSNFQMDNDSKALGNIHTINAPYFENEFYPESLIVKALIYYNRCHFDKSQAAIDEFKATYPKLKQDIDKLVAKYPDNGDFYNYVVKIRNGEANLSERVMHAAIGALSDKTLQKEIEYVSELDRELKAIDKADPAWKSTAIASNILQDLTLQKSLAVNEAGNLARARLKRLSSEIREQNNQALRIEVEMLGKQKTEIEAQANGTGTVGGGSVAVVKGGNVVVDDEHMSWPFDGEYWKDELGTYRFKVANLCRK